MSAWNASTATSRQGDQLATRTLTQVMVTKRGKAVAGLAPPDNPEDAVRYLHGFMRGSVVGPVGFDLTAPVLAEALLGR